MSEESRRHVDIPIEWCVPPDLQTFFSNNFVIQNIGENFIISFFEIFPPILLGEPQAVQLQMAMIDKISAKCLARIVVSKTGFAEFVQLMNEQFQKLQENKPE